MSNYADVMAGLRDRLNSGITDMQAYDYPPDSVNKYPTAIVIPSAEYEITFAGNTFQAAVSVWVLVSSGDDAIGFRRLYDMLDPTDANRSVKGAIDGDSTLGGNVDYARVMSARNIGRQEVFGGWYYAAEFLVEMVKTVG